MNISTYGAESVNAFWGNDGNDMVMIGHQDISDFNVENILSQPQDKLDEIRTWLSPTQYDDDSSEYQKHLSSHLAGTGTWVYDTQEYTQWHDTDEHGILWVRGIPGSGKSVLASTLIDHFVLENAPVLYFFFRHTIMGNHGPEALLRDWLAQILDFSPPVQLKLMAYTESKYNRVPVEDLSTVELWRYLRMAMMYLPRVYCVVDALDEMDRDALGPFLHALDALGSWRPANVKVIVTSRPIAVVEQVLRKFKLLDVRLVGGKVEDDVSRYVHHRLDMSLLSPDSRTYAEQAVLAKADGLFLYAKLALDTVLQAETDAQIHLELEEMPADLTVMYTNLLRHHSSRTGTPSNLQELVLQLVTHATRPLRLLEIAELVRVEQDPDGDLGEVKDRVRLSCGPLLEILPDETVRVVHHSLTEYLKGDTRVSHTRPFAVFEAGDVNNKLAIHCLRYLAAGCLDEVKIRGRRKIEGDINCVEPAVLVPRQLLPHFAAYAGSEWPVHVRRAITAGHDQTEVNDLLDNVLTRADLDKLDVLAHTQMNHQPSPLRFAIALDLRDYAERLFSPDRPDSVKEILLDESILLYATEKNNDFMVELLLDHDADINVRDLYGRTALHVAVLAGRTKIAMLLLDAGIDPETQSGPDKVHGMPGEGEEPWTPSAWALSHGSLEMATLFKERLQTTEGIEKAFHQAVTGQNHEVILDLSRELKVDINSKVDDSTALYKATLNRDTTTMRILLQNGADPNILHNISTDEYEYASDTPSEELDHAPLASSEMDITTPKPKSEDLGENVLHALVREPWRSTQDTSVLLECLALLLQHGANVHQMDARGNAPLHLARNAALVTALLDAGADPNAINFEGETLMHTAFSLDVLATLIPQARLDARLKATNRTPLLSALLERHSVFESDERQIEKAIWLLDNGADVTAVDYDGNSALHLAVRIRNIEKSGVELVRRLCRVPTLVNQQNKNGKTPLHMNGPGSDRYDGSGFDSGTFRLGVFELLIAANANLEIRDNQGQTPLFQFVQATGSWRDQEDQSVLSRMIKDGSQVKTLDSRGRTLLHAACSRAPVCPARVKFLLSQGLDLTVVDNDGNTLLHEVAPQLAKNRASLADIDSFGLDPPRQNTFGQPATPQAAKSRASLADIVLSLGIDPLQQNTFGRTALHVLSSFRPAAFESNNKVRRPDDPEDACMFGEYMRLYGDVDVTDKHGVTPLHLASTFSEFLTRSLLEAGANACKPTSEGLTPFHLAARSRRANIIGLLLEHLVSRIPPKELTDVLDAKDSLNRSALYYAAASGHAPSVQLLVDAGANTDHDRYGGSPWNGCADFEDELATADWSRHFDTGSYRNKRKRVVGETDAGGVMISDTVRPEKVIYESNMDYPRFPVERLDDIVRILLSNASEKAASFIQQAIEAALKKGHIYTSKTLLRACDALQCTLEPAIRAEIHNASMEKGSSQAGCDSFSGKPTADLMRSRDYTAVMHGSSTIDCVERLSWTGDSTLLHQFVLGGFTDLASEATTDEAVARTEWREARDSGKMSPRPSVEHVHPLIIAACQREEPNMDVLRMLVEKKKVDVNARMAGSHYPDDNIPNGASALHYLVEGGHWWQTALGIPYLVEHGASLEIKDTNGLTPLGVTLQPIGGPRFDRKTVEMLLRLSANPNEEDSQGRSYLSMVVNHKDIFELLVSKGAIISPPTMIAAIRAQDVDLLRTMLDGGADPNMRKVGREEPQVQTGENSWTMRRYDPDNISEMYLIDFIATHTTRSESAEDGNVEMLKMLVSYGADPFARYEKTTVLHRVLENRISGDTVSGGINPYLEILLDLPGLDYETRDSDGMTLVLLAGTRLYDVDVEPKLALIQKLVGLGADIHARDNEGRTVLHHLCAKGNRYWNRKPSIEDVEFVVSRAAELVHAIDNGGSTPLQYALSGRTDVAGTLISLGADVRHANHKGDTVLHVILKRAKWTVTADESVDDNLWHSLFDRVIGLGADINARNAAGETPLFAYFRTGTVTGEVSLPRLTEFEAEEEKRQGSSYLRLRKKEQLERAAGVEKEHVVWKLFDRLGADWSGLNDAGHSLLHIVAEDTSPTSPENHDHWSGRRVKRFEFLMGKGLDPRIEDHEHRTPLDLAASLGLDDLLKLFQNDH